MKDYTPKVIRAEELDNEYYVLAVLRDDQIDRIADAVVRRLRGESDTSRGPAPSASHRTLSWRAQP